MESEPGLPLDRRQEIDTQLDPVVRSLRRSDKGASDVGNSRAATPSERLAAAQRYAVEAQAAAAEVLAFSAEAFRHPVEAHECAATLPDKTAAKGIGDVRGHERQQRSTGAAYARRTV